MKKILFAITVLWLFTPNAFSAKNPLQVTIQSDRKAYQLGEDIRIDSEFKNISKDTIKTNDFFSFDCTLILRNEKGQESRLEYDGPVNASTPLKLSPGASFKILNAPLDLVKAKNFESEPYVYKLKNKNYDLLGEHHIYMLSGSLVSNTISIKVAEKKSI